MNFDFNNSRNIMFILGQPDQPVIVSNIQSYAETEYTLSWRVWTPPTLPILNQSILYRLKSKVFLFLTRVYYTDSSVRYSYS